VRAAISLPVETPRRKNVAGIKKKTTQKLRMPKKAMTHGLKIALCVLGRTKIIDRSGRLKALRQEMIPPRPRRWWG